MLTWFHFTIASIFFLASYYFFSKKLFKEENEVDPRFYGACLQFVTGLLALPFALINGFNFNVTPVSIGLLVTTALAYTIGPSLYYIGLKHVDLSETTVLDASGIFWSLAFGGYLLNESFTQEKIVGSALILIAIVIVTYKKGKKLFAMSKYEAFILTSPIFYALGATLDNKLVTFSNAASYLAISFMTAGVSMFIFNAHRLKSVGLTSIKNKKFIKTVFLNAIFVSLTYFFVLRAYELGGEVSRMYPIQQTESVLVPLIAIVLLKERKRLPQKIVAAVIAFIGLLLIKG
jgi:drug/metabolite transporter (DMT)-like permease